MFNSRIHHFIKDWLPIKEFVLNVINKNNVWENPTHEDFKIHTGMKYAQLISRGREI